jgi:signal transduction histidine kinase
VHPDDVDNTLVEIEKLVKGSPIVQYINRYRTSSGDYKWLSWSAMRDGALVYAVARDVTERLKAEQVLRDQQAQQVELTLAQDKARFLSQFLTEIGEITHDLKMPLSVINTSLYFLERPIDETARHERIQRIQEQTTLMTRYIQNILAISQLERAEQLVLSPIDLNVLATSTHADYRAQIERKALRITVDVPDTIVRVSADQTQLYRAMCNLVEYAIHYTPDGGAITLRVLVERDFAVFEVEDTGMGIEPAEQPFIFERFFRGSNVRTGTQTGTGLGLAIVRKIVQMHGGSVEVDSTPGQGSTFTLRVPLVEEPAKV